jgi:phosphatidylserine synthase
VSGGDSDPAEWDSCTGLSGRVGGTVYRYAGEDGAGQFFIGLAALVDFLDGLVARLFKATSPIGKELDSLADVVSFGVAPGMILYQLLRLSFASQETGWMYR